MSLQVARLELGTVVSNEKTITVGFEDELSPFLPWRKRALQMALRFMGHVSAVAGKINSA